MREVITALQSDVARGALPPFRFIEINAMALSKAEDFYKLLWRKLTGERERDPQVALGYLAEHYKGKFQEDAAAAAAAAATSKGATKAHARSSTSKAAAKQRPASSAKSAKSARRRAKNADDDAYSAASSDEDSDERDWKSLNKQSKRKKTPAKIKNLLRKLSDDYW